MKCDLNVHCKMGPRCTPEVPGRAVGSVLFDLALPGQQSSGFSQTFLSDHNLHHGMVLPAGTVDQHKPVLG